MLWEREHNLALVTHCFGVSWFSHGFERSQMVLSCQILPGGPHTGIPGVSQKFTLIPWVVNPKGHSLLEREILLIFIWGTLPLYFYPWILWKKNLFWPHELTFLKIKKIKTTIHFLHERYCCCFSGVHCKYVLTELFTGEYQARTQIESEREKYATYRTAVYIKQTRGARNFWSRINTANPTAGVL